MMSPQLGGLSHFSEYSLETPSQTNQKVCLLGASISCEVRHQYEPTHQPSKFQAMWGPWGGERETMCPVCWKNDPENRSQERVPKAPAQKVRWLQGQQQPLRKAPGAILFQGSEALTPALVSLSYAVNQEAEVKKWKWTYF